MKRSIALKLPPGDLGTDCTVAAMRAIVEDAAESEHVETVLRGLADRSSDIPSELYDWLRDNRVFKRDPKGIEHLRHPDEFIPSMLQGSKPGMDCDDVAVIGASVLLAANIRPAVVVLGKKPYPASFQHVFYASYAGPARVVGTYLDNEKPAGFVPWDPQEAKRVPKGQMSSNARFRVYPC